MYNMYVVSVIGAVSRSPLRDSLASLARQTPLALCIPDIVRDWCQSTWSSRVIGFLGAAW